VKLVGIRLVVLVLMDGFLSLGPRPACLVVPGLLLDHHLRRSVFLPARHEELGSPAKLGVLDASASLVVSPACRAAFLEQQFTAVVGYFS